MIDLTGMTAEKGSDNCPHLLDWLEIVLASLKAVATTTKREGGKRG